MIFLAPSWIAFHRCDRPTELAHHEARHVGANFQFVQIPKRGDMLPACPGQLARISRCLDGYDHNLPREKGECVLLRRLQTVAMLQ